MLLLPYLASVLIRPSSAPFDSATGLRRQITDLVKKDWSALPWREVDQPLGWDKDGGDPGIRLQFRYKKVLVMGSGRPDGKVNEFRYQPVVSIFIMPPSWSGRTFDEQIQGGVVSKSHNPPMQAAPSEYLGMTRGTQQLFATMTDGPWLELVSRLETKLHLTDGDGRYRVRHPGQ